MELINKVAVVAEIEKRKQKLLDHIICESDKEFACRTAHHLNRIKDFIDALEVKEVDLEKELYKAFGQVKDFTLGMCIARHFYELGLKTKKGE